MNRASTKILARDAAIQRGLDFVYRFGGKPDSFEDYGSFLICCFALLSVTSRDPKLRQLGRTRAIQLIRRWSRDHPHLPPDASPDLVFDFVLVRYALKRLGMQNQALTAQIEAAAKRFSALDLLGFDPLSEPPPGDLPDLCDCGLQNPRGRKVCQNCKRRLSIQSHYRVWMKALANTYVAEQCGLHFGARYVDVLRWLPALRPYPAIPGQDEDDEVWRDAIYAVTHIVYSFDDYGTYRLSPRWLPREFAFIKANVKAACHRNDPEILGELLDSLKAFGLKATHPLVDYGMKYLLGVQNKDGSWGDPGEDNIRLRCHTTWTAIDGLRSYAWRGQRLRFPEVKSILNRPKQR